MTVSQHLFQMIFSYHSEEQPIQYKILPSTTTPSILLDLAPEESEDAHLYRKLPMASCSYASECSNLFSDNFSTVGRKNAIKSSILYVIESEDNKNFYLDMVKSDTMRINLVPSNKKKEKTIQWSH